MLAFATPGALEWIIILGIVALVVFVILRR
jgi:Sec-independent protein translocase protein TatA